MMLLALLSLPAYPCAAIMVEEGGSASTSAQEVILDQGDGYVDVTYRVEVDNDVHSLGWIIPIYGEFVELADADPTRFHDLRDLTAPLVMIQGVDDSDDGGGSGGCGDKAIGMERGGGASWDNDQSLGVEVVAEGYSGTYGYSVLDASSDTALVQWLADNGFSIGPTGPAISTYVDEGGVYFVALDVDLDGADDSTRELPAVRIRYQGDSLRYPALMARYGMPDRVSTRAFVLGDQRATVGGGWSSEEFSHREAANTAEMSNDQAYREVLMDIAREDAHYAEIWSGSYQDGWLTRFDTVAAKEAHSSDVQFRLDGGVDEIRSELWRWDTGDFAWLLAPTALLGLAGLRRRRPTGC